MQTEFKSNLPSQPDLEIADRNIFGLGTPMMRGKAELLRSFRGFFVVGIAATIVHYIVLKIVMGTGLVSSIAVANVCGYISGLVVSYSGNRFFVFEAKRGHVDGFLILAGGYLVALAIHTGLMVGLTEGQIFRTLDGPLAILGGGLLIDLWHWILRVMPDGLAYALTDGDNMRLSTSPAFIIASGVGAVMTFFWNRFVVFQPKTAQP